MAKSVKKTSNNKKNQSAFQKFKRAILGIGILGLIGLAADFLGLISFFDKSEPETKTQTTTNNVGNSSDTYTYNYQTINQTSFIEKTEYNNCQITNQSIPQKNNSSKNNTNKTKIDTTVSNTTIENQSDIAKAMNYYCNNEFSLALEYINKYDTSTTNVDLVFFYTLKAEILFYNKDFDNSYRYLLLAFKTDKNSKYLNLPKLRGLTYAYAHLKSRGHTLKELKNLELSNDRKMIIYDLGVEKIEMHNGWILLDEKEDNEEFIKLLHELKMVLPHQIVK